MSYLASSVARRRYAGHLTSLQAGRLGGQLAADQCISGATEVARVAVDHCTLLYGGVNTLPRLQGSRSREKNVVFQMDVLVQITFKLDQRGEKRPVRVARFI
jgi:hypothetical protein